MTRGQAKVKIVSVIVEDLQTTPQRWCHNRGLSGALSTSDGLKLVPITQEIASTRESKKAGWNPTIATAYAQYDQNGILYTTLDGKWEVQSDQRGNVLCDPDGSTPGRQVLSQITEGKSSWAPPFAAGSRVSKDYPCSPVVPPVEKY